ncbi:MAG TPA: AAA family ATPase [Verrucomicrobiae bacterium]
MDAVLFIGLQGSGKSSYYQRQFSATHARINLDLLKTRPRELQFLNSLLVENKPFVVDNTNVTIEQRLRYIVPAKAAGYKVFGYFFNVPIKTCLERNHLRSGKEKVPVPGIYGARKRLQLPSLAEGFDALFTVELTDTVDFRVLDWPPGSLLI